MQKISVWVVVVAAMLGAVYIARAIVDQNSLILFVMVATVLGLLYLLKLYQYTWQIALFACSIGCTCAPLGFKISSIELSAVLVVALLSIAWWRKDLIMHYQLRRQPVTIIFFCALFLLLIYAVCHFYVYWRYPFLPAEYSVRNSLKQMFQSYVPMVVVLVVMLKPGMLRLGRHITKTLVFITLFSLILDIGVKCYSVFIQGPGVFGDKDNARLFIAGINLMENIYILRLLGPFAVLLGMFLLAERNKNANCGVYKVVLGLMVLLGLVGSLLSGGRLAVILCILFAVVALLIKKRILALLCMGMFCGGVIAVINLFSNQIFVNNMPERIKRTLYLVSFDRNANALQHAKGSIQSSSEWRKELFIRSIKEWQSNRTVIWFGRDVYAFNDDDLLGMSIKGVYEGGMDSSLRRGATHNLISDLLLIYGLIGAILYYLVLVSMVFFLLFILRKIPKEWSERNIVLITLISLIYWIAYAQIGGTWFSDNLAWLVAVCITIGNSYYSNCKESAQPLEGIAKNKKLK
jgi:hypothetical protein